jgi:hypothetical protein
MRDASPAPLHARSSTPTVEKEALGIWLDVQAETWEGSGPRTPRKDGESATEESMSSLCSKETSNDVKEALETTRLTLGAGDDKLVTVRRLVHHPPS